MERTCGEGTTSFSRTWIGRYVYGKSTGPGLNTMVGSTSYGFSHLVLASERIENMIKMGKIQNSASTSDVVRKTLYSLWKEKGGRNKCNRSGQSKSPNVLCPISTSCHSGASPTTTTTIYNSNSTTSTTLTTITITTISATTTKSVTLSTTAATLTTFEEDI